MAIAGDTYLPEGSKSNLIIVEGPKGVGKTTTTNWLREQIAFSNLYRLSGPREKGQSGKFHAHSLHHQTLKYIDSLHTLNMTHILDRTFFSEYVYCELGYKPYSFRRDTEELCAQLASMHCRFNILVLSLSLHDTSLYQNRLGRAKGAYLEQYKPENIKIDYSIEQQHAYELLFRWVDQKYNCPKPKMPVFHILTDDEASSHAMLAFTVNSITGQKLITN